MITSVVPATAWSSAILRKELPSKQEKLQTIPVFGECQNSAEWGHERDPANRLKNAFSPYNATLLPEEQKQPYADVYWDSTGDSQKTIGTSLPKP